jgi:hypothetical protein
MTETGATGLGGAIAALVQSGLGDRDGSDADRAQQDSQDSSRPTAASHSNAFVLGWQMARLYRSQSSAWTHPSTEQLSSLGTLPVHAAGEVALEQLHSGLIKLAPVITAANLPVPDARSAMQALSDGTSDQRQDVLRSFHDVLQGTLHAVDDRLGKAYDLGRALADTCFGPNDSRELAEYLGPDRLRTIEKVGRRGQSESAVRWRHRRGPPPSPAGGVVARLTRR